MDYFRDYFDETSTAINDFSWKTVTNINAKHVKVETSVKDKQCFTLGIFFNFTGSLLKSTIILLSSGKKNKIKTSLIKSNLIVLYHDNLLEKKNVIEIKRWKKLTSWYHYQ